MLTQIIRQPLPVLGCYHALVLQVTLVPYQEHLRIVPRVGLDLGGPGKVEDCEVRDQGSEVEGTRSEIRGYSPILHGRKGVLVGHVIHKQEAHGATIVGRGDGPIALLARCVLGESSSRLGLGTT